MLKLVSGVQINYYFICKTKLWLYSHNIHLENESDNVKLGKLLHEESYKESKKEFLIDNKINIDFIEHKNGIIEVHEIKKSDKMIKSDKYQLLYYLYYLKKEKDIVNTVGILNYPLLKKTEQYTLTNKYEEKIEDIIKEINRINLKNMPKPKYTKICLKCAYREFCFS